MVVILCCDCYRRSEVPEGFFEGTARPFWLRHGHFPAVVVYACSCGAEQVSGAGVHGDSREAAQKAALADLAFYREHRTCP